MDKINVSINFEKDDKIKINMTKDNLKVFLEQLNKQEKFISIKDEDVRYYINKDIATYVTFNPELKDVCYVPNI